MNTADMIKSLEELGFKVVITHNRRINDHGETLPTGGFTLVELIRAGNKKLMDEEDTAPIDGNFRSCISYIGVSRCSNKDSYCKKAGVELALNRALDILHSSQLAHR